MLHTDTMLKSVLKAENPHENDSFVMNAHATRKSPTAHTWPPAPFTPARSCPHLPTPAHNRKHVEAHGIMGKQAEAGGSRWKQAEARGSTQLNAYRWHTKALYCIHTRPHTPKPTSKKILRLYMALLTIFCCGFLDDVIWLCWQFFAVAF